MINDKEAIEKSAEYLKLLSSELSGNLLERPEQVRLESVQKLGKDWIVVLSYFTKASKRKPEWVNILEGVRRFKEFRVNSSGIVTAMKDPALA